MLRSLAALLDVRGLAEKPSGVCSGCAVSIADLRDALLRTGTPAAPPSHSPSEEEEEGEPCDYCEKRKLTRVPSKFFPDKVRICESCASMEAKMCPTLPRQRIGPRATSTALNITSPDDKIRLRDTPAFVRIAPWIANAGTTDKGRGLFATRNIKKNEVVALYGGTDDGPMRIDKPGPEADAAYKSPYIFEYRIVDELKAPKTKLVWEIGDTDGDVHVGHICNQVPAYGYDDPIMVYMNAALDTVKVDGQPRACIVAIDDVAAGSEFITWYGAVYSKVGSEAVLPMLQPPKSYPKYKNPLYQPGALPEHIDIWDTLRSRKPDSEWALQKKVEEVAVCLQTKPKSDNVIVIIGPGMSEAASPAFKLPTRGQMITVNPHSRFKHWSDVRKFVVQNDIEPTAAHRMVAALFHETIATFKSVISLNVDLLEESAGMQDSPRADGHGNLVMFNVSKRPAEGEPQFVEGEEDYDPAVCDRAKKLLKKASLILLLGEPMKVRRIYDVVHDAAPHVPKYSISRFRPTIPPKYEESGSAKHVVASPADFMERLWAKLQIKIPDSTQQDIDRVAREAIQRAEQPKTSTTPAPAPPQSLPPAPKPVTQTKVAQAPLQNLPLAPKPIPQTKPAPVLSRKPPLAETAVPKPVLQSEPAPLPKATMLKQVQIPLPRPATADVAKPTAEIGSSDVAVTSRQRRTARLRKRLRKLASSSGIRPESEQQPSEEGLRGAIIKVNRVVDTTAMQYALLVPQNMIPAVEMRWLAELLVAHSWRMPFFDDDFGDVDASSAAVLAFAAAAWMSTKDPKRRQIVRDVRVWNAVAAATTADPGVYVADTSAGNILVTMVTEHPEPRGWTLYEGFDVFVAAGAACRGMVRGGMRSLLTEEFVVFLRNIDMAISVYPELQNTVEVLVHRKKGRPTGGEDVTRYQENYVDETHAWYNGHTDTQMSVPIEYAQPSESGGGSAPETALVIRATDLVTLHVHDDAPSEEAIAAYMSLLAARSRRRGSTLPLIAALAPYAVNRERGHRSKHVHWPTGTSWSSLQSGITYAMMPVKVRGHWMLAVRVAATYKTVVFDSVPGELAADGKSSGDAEENEDLREACAAAFGDPAYEYKLLNMQTHASVVRDSGVYLCAIADRLCRNMLPDTRSVNVVTWRCLVEYEILDRRAADRQSGPSPVVGASSLGEALHQTRLEDLPQLLCDAMSKIPPTGRKYDHAPTATVVLVVMALTRLVQSGHREAAWDVFYGAPKAATGLYVRETQTQGICIESVIPGKAVLSWTKDTAFAAASCALFAAFNIAMRGDRAELETWHDYLNVHDDVRHLADLATSRRCGDSDEARKEADGLTKDENDFVDAVLRGGSAFVPMGPDATAEITRSDLRSVRVPNEVMKPATIKAYMTLLEKWWTGKKRATPLVVKSARDPDCANADYALVVTSMLVGASFKHALILFLPKVSVATVFYNIAHESVGMNKETALSNARCALGVGATSMAIRWQGSEVDDGVIVCATANMLYREQEFDFLHMNVPAWRCIIAYELLTGCMLPFAQGNKLYT